MADMIELRVKVPAELHERLMQEAGESSRTPDEVVGELLAMKFQSGKQKTVGKVVEGSIRKGATNKQALALARESFPQAETSAASVAWYRTNLRKNGEDVPTDSEARAAAAFPG